MKQILDEKLARIARAWPELEAADGEINAGLGIEILSAKGYADIDGLTIEQYIVRVLRAERDRRQAIDRLSGDDWMVKQLFESAEAEEKDVLTYMADKYGTGRVKDLSRDFLVKIIRYLNKEAQ